MKATSLAAITLNNIKIYDQEFEVNIECGLNSTQITAPVELEGPEKVYLEMMPP